MAVTPEIRAEIIREFRSTRSPFKVSTKVGVPVEDVIEVMEDYEEKASVVPERNNGDGRPEIKRFVVGKRKAGERSWDNSEPKIAKARRDYEAGTHIMATGRDGAWLLLYSFPRTGRPDRTLRDYFKFEVA